MQYIFNHENNVPSRLYPQWLCGISGTWVHDIRLHIASTNELKSDQQAKQDALLVHWHQQSFGSLYTV